MKKLIAAVMLSAAFITVAECAEKKFASVVGYVRGRSKTTLKNKYSGYVTKVNFYSQSRVKKGDVILEYDDWEVRSKIAKKQKEIEKQRVSIELKEIALKIAEINPLPSEWRNLASKHKAAEESVRRFNHELEVYRKLYRNKAISDLALREKLEAQVDHEADLACLRSDMQIVGKGLGGFYLQKAQQELAEARAALEVMNAELASLEEERKYYKIVAPYDGLCITDSDTIGGYYTSGTAAAMVHKDEKKRVYAMIRVEDLPYAKEGTTYRFRSNQYGYKSDLVFEVRLYKIDRTRQVYGDGSFFQCKFDVVTEPQPLRIDSIGTIEMPIE